MKYKVGDKVRIKSIDWYNKNKDMNNWVSSQYSTKVFNLGMSRLCGMTATILSIQEKFGSYKIDRDNARFFWTDEMFEEINKNNKMETKRVKITLPKNFEVEKVETSVEGGFLIVEYTPKYEPKVGDIVFATAGIGSNPQQFIFIYGISTVSLCKGRGLSPLNELEYNGTPISWAFSHIRLATDEEKETFLRKLKEAGYTFNQETKKLEKIRWRAKNGQGYFIVSGALTIEYYSEDGDRTDNAFYLANNYFQTKKEAMEARDKIKELLKNK